MAAVMIDKSAETLLTSWGFGTTANDQLIEHANNVIENRSKRAGDIVVALGMASQDQVTQLLRNKPSDVRSLAYLRNTIRALSTRVDEVLSIQAGVPYLSRTMANMAVHPSVKGEFLNKLRDEMNRQDVVPVMCGGELILLFSDFEKMIMFKAMGKQDRMNSPLYTVFGELLNLRPDRLNFYTAVADSTVFLTYQQQLSDTDSGQAIQEEALQTISQVEGASDPIINLIVRILNEAIGQEINDVQIAPDRNTGKGVVFFRRYQRLTNSGITMAPEERQSVERLLLARSKANPSGGRLRHPADGNLNFEGKFGQAFLRMSFIPLEESRIPATSISIRILPKTSKSISLSSLGIAPVVVDELNYFARRKFGLFVVCGPTGSGKSTTIGGMICSHYDEYGDSLKRLSVEQPCERILPGVYHIDVSQHHYPGDKRDTDNFAMALRAILRHDPDLIFVGEVRDKESCMVSVDSANTGHLVFTTTHANDPVLGYRRLASFLDKERRFDLVNVLEGILAQRLISTICPHCSSERSFDTADLKKLERYAVIKGVDIGRLSIPSTHRVANHAGCNQCVYGYAGMVPIHGLLTLNPRVRELLLSSDESDWMKAQAASDSQVTLFSSAFALFEKGLVDLEAVML